MVAMDRDKTLLEQVDEYLHLHEQACIPAKYKLTDEWCLDKPVHIDLTLRNLLEIQTALQYGKDHGLEFLVGEYPDPDYS